MLAVLALCFGGIPKTAGYGPAENVVALTDGWITAVRGIGYAGTPELAVELVGKPDSSYWWGRTGEQRFSAGHGPLCSHRGGIWFRGLAIPREWVPESGANAARRWKGKATTLRGWLTGKPPIGRRERTAIQG